MAGSVCGCRRAASSHGHPPRVRVADRRRDRGPDQPRCSGSAGWSAGRELFRAQPRRGGVRDDDVAGVDRGSGRSDQRRCDGHACWDPATTNIGRPKQYRQAQADADTEHDAARSGCLPMPRRRGRWPCWASDSSIAPRHKPPSRRRREGDPTTPVPGESSRRATTGPDHRLPIRLWYARTSDLICGHERRHRTRPCRRYRDDSRRRTPRIPQGNLRGRRR